MKDPDRTADWAPLRDRLDHLERRNRLLVRAILVLLLLIGLCLIINELRFQRHSENHAPKVTPP